MTYYFQVIIGYLFILAYTKLCFGLYVYFTFQAKCVAHVWIKSPYNVSSSFYFFEIKEM